MSQASSTARLLLLPDDRRFVPDITPTLDADEHGSRIRARRVFAAAPEDVFMAWTNAAAWEVWMRLRSKSRATMAPCEGGAFRLEVAEGAHIHVITGDVTELGVERFSLTWCHHETSERSSLVSVTILESGHGSMMTFVHDHIASRREASWLMRFWSTAHQRLAEFVSNRPVLPMRRRDIAFGLVDGASAVARGVSSCHA